MFSTVLSPNFCWCHHNKSSTPFAFLFKWFTHSSLYQKLLEGCIHLIIVLFKKFLNAGNNSDKRSIILSLVVILNLLRVLTCSSPVQHVSDGSFSLKKKVWFMNIILCGKFLDLYPKQIEFILCSKLGINWCHLCTLQGLI